ncbi:hypothetical protein C2845_PM09G03230 [Panicum miliaceum]|uniref:Uncharacterized protein n=1 Tax=Panicum miliaceum TaxID=4540 RepID=A0A3L6RYM6_PANMI|nr:hypothetical protein C2845_PM09G03230 [Panicum miliaceum]
MDGAGFRLSRARTRAAEQTAEPDGGGTTAHEPCLADPSVSSSRSARGQQSEEASGGGGDGQAPHHGGRGSGRHDRRDLPREPQREQRGERPHGAPRPLPGRGPPRRALVVAEAAEEQQQGGVGAQDEEDGARVAPGAVEGQRRVDGEQAEPRLGGPGWRKVAVVRHGRAATLLALLAGSKRL